MSTAAPMRLVPPWCSEPETLSVFIGDFSGFQNPLSLDEIVNVFGADKVYRPSELLLELVL